MRGTIVPTTVGALPNTESGVTGTTASWQDSADKLKSDLLPVVAFVLLLAFVLMLFAFRSVVIAAKAIVLNLLSVGAAYGVLVLVFQHGLGKGLLGSSSSDGDRPVVPLLLFVILFGLSMDYHVFIISRIREKFDRGATDGRRGRRRDQVHRGRRDQRGDRHGRRVLDLRDALELFFKQFGVGLAAAILIDATIVRAVLLPATMKLLGEWNWYLPALARVASPAARAASLSSLTEPEPGRRHPRRRHPRRKRRLGFARLTGLVLIAIIALGLAYVKLALRRRHGLRACWGEGRPADPASVPLRHGAGSYAADCGTLVVPENRADPSLG